MILDFRIDGDFLFKQAPWLTWRQLAYGYWNNYITAKAVVDFAVLKLDVSSNDMEVDLAVADPTDGTRVNFLLEHLKITSPLSDCAEVWFFIIMSWLYEHRETYSEALLTAKLVYENFGKPEDLDILISEINSKENKAKIYNDLHKFLEKYKSRLNCY